MLLPLGIESETMHAVASLSLWHIDSLRRMIEIQIRGYIARNCRLDKWAYFPPPL
jgi:hypothetical protein